MPRRSSLQIDLERALRDPRYRVVRAAAETWLARGGPVDRAMLDAIAAHRPAHPTSTAVLLRRAFEAAAPKERARWLARAPDDPARAVLGARVRACRDPALVGVWLLEHPLQPETREALATWAGHPLTNRQAFAIDRWALAAFARMRPAQQRRTAAVLVRRLQTAARAKSAHFSGADLRLVGRVAPKAFRPQHEALRALAGDPRSIGALALGLLMTSGGLDAHTAELAHALRPTERRAFLDADPRTRLDLALDCLPTSVRWLARHHPRSTTVRTRVSTLPASQQAEWRFAMPDSPAMRQKLLEDALRPRQSATRRRRVLHELVFRQDWARANRLFPRVLEDGATLGGLGGWVDNPLLDHLDAATIRRVKPTMLARLQRHAPHEARMAALLLARANIRVPRPRSRRDPVSQLAYLPLLSRDDARALLTEVRDAAIHVAGHWPSLHVPHPLAARAQHAVDRRYVALALEHADVLSEHVLLTLLREWPELATPFLERLRRWTLELDDHRLAARAEGALVRALAARSERDERLAWPALARRLVGRLFRVDVAEARLTAEALARLTARGRTAPLRARLASPKPFHRVRAMLAIGALGANARGFAAELEERVEHDPRRYVRRHALRALDRVAPLDPKLLRRLLRDDDPRMRAMAARRRLR